MLLTDFKHKSSLFLPIQFSLFCRFACYISQIQGPLAQVKKGRNIHDLA